tara:strand:- start:5407 stop:5997 length:591 start_codon:yes stop_codon:yes gene_type:complete
MKRVIQIILYIFLIIIILLFYKIYFKNTETVSQNTLLPKNDTVEQSETDLIKNLKYEINLDKENMYMITAELSKINSIDNIDIVEMEKVFGMIKSQNRSSLTITSDKAIFNKSNFNTLFKENVEIKYINNIILSDEVELNYEDNLIEISKNIFFKGPKISMKTDKIKINLITKKIDIYNDDDIKNVEIEIKEDVKY